MAEYYRIKFTSGLEGEGYQEMVSDNVVVKANARVARITDLNGNTLNVPEKLEYEVVGEETPEWAV
jgi:hypothetical protein